MNLKRKVALALTAIMMVQVPFSAIGSVKSESAADAIRIVESYRSGSEKADGEEYDENIPALMSFIPDFGSLKIDMTGAAPAKASSWDIELMPLDDDDIVTEAYTETIELPASSRGAHSHASVTMKNVPAGTYTLRLIPDRANDTSYLTYDQGEITIGKNVTTVHLINGDPEDYGYENGEKYGVLVMGDIDGNGEIEQTDLDILTKHLSEGIQADEIPEEEEEEQEMEDSGSRSVAETDAFHNRSDLNGDGEVTLLDAACFAKYYGTDLEGRVALPSTSVLITKEEVTVASDSNASKINGSLEETFSGSSDVPLTVEFEEISEETPAVIATEFSDPKPMEGLVIDPVAGSEDSIVDGEIIITDSDGVEHLFIVTDGEAVEVTDDESSRIRTVAENILSVMNPVMIAYAAEEDTSAKMAKPIVIDLGGQVAVKKITIKVTKTLAKNPTLVDISKVEFYDDMADRVGQPALSIPEKLAVENGSAQFILTWKNVPNVTSYEVTISGEDLNGTAGTDVAIVETNRLEVTSLGYGDGKVVNNRDYQVSVRSINGSWKSEAATIVAHPTANAVPPAPENLVIDPGYKLLKLSWKNMRDTDSYTLYYKEVSETAETETESIPNIEAYSYTLEDLKTDTEYEVWLTGTNGQGTGPESIHYKARTTTLNPPVTPNYKLINIADKGEDLTRHIQSATRTHGTDNAEAVVDGDYSTAWVLNDWDAGYYYGNRMPVVTFDNKYTMNTVVLIPDENQTYTFSNGKLFYRDDDGKEQLAAGRMTRKSSNGKYYYMFTTYEPITTDQIRLAVYTYSTNRRIGVAEIKFYYYDDIETDIMDLYEDVYHIALKETVGQEDIDDLRARLEVVDEETQELHPRKKELDAELDNAQELLDNKDKQCEIRIVDSKDTQATDKYITFKGGLNVYQPLGVTAMAGDELTVYVGGPTVRDGESTRLELVAAQYHGSSAAVFVSQGYLTGGSNAVTVKAVDKMSDYERGGQLYVHYTGAAGEESYGVRVLGGRKSAYLDISDFTDSEEDHEMKVSLAEEYIADVKEQLQNAETYHDEDHGLNSEAKNKFEHDPQNCVYHATDIVSRYAMFSTSVDQVLAGLNEATSNGSDRELAEQLVNTMDAMDQMLVLYYHHKGLSEDLEAPETNRMPVSRINIRYQRMFAGAFMYAGGKHIGIEWPELKGLMGGHPIEADEDGKYISGNLFGWGIGHEIGHEINESTYVTAEVTNNYFSVLAQAEQSENFNDDVRFKYDDVFAKVTSGTSGKASNVFTQLAMYWQLHLAYDLGGYNYKIYDTNKEQLENLFWARVDSYIRDMSKAPGEKPNEKQGIEGNLLNLDTDKDNKLMRLAVAAAEKDILEFFERYGYKPDEGTRKYASQFPKETRGIWFANDEYRAKQIEAGTAENLAEDETVSGTIDYTPGTNVVTLDLKSSSNIWMYEIYRLEHIKGDVVKRPVGYAQADGSGNAEFSDVIGTINNRAFTYEAVGYDMWLNPTEAKEVGTVKVTHDGLIDKTLWTVDSNMTNDELTLPNKDNPDVSEQPGLDDMVDDSDATSFTGKVAASEDPAVSRVPEIIINFNNQETVTGLRYKADPEVSFRAYVSMDGSEWTEVFMKTMKNSESEKLIYFDDGTNLYTYDAAYMRLVAEDENGPITDGREITVTEISVLGQTGDNVDLLESGMGILSEEYRNGDAVIPKGSLIFTGTYKGNPAYNAVLLWDEDGNVVGGMDEEGTVHAEQIIFAPEPEGMLDEVSEGFYVYYITPDKVDSVKESLAGHSVRAELYRVDNAETNAGERLVSSTVFVSIPSELPPVKLSTGGLTP